MARSFGLGVAWSVAAVALLAAAAAMVRIPSTTRQEIVVPIPAAESRSTMVNSAPVP
jgi:hypothetical protein